MLLPSCMHPHISPGLRPGHPSAPCGNVTSLLHLAPFWGALVSLLSGLCMVQPHNLASGLLAVFCVFVSAYGPSYGPLCWTLPTGVPCSAHAFEYQPENALVCLRWGTHVNTRLVSTRFRNLDFWDCE